MNSSLLFRVAAVGGLWAGALFAAEPVPAKPADAAPPLGALPDPLPAVAPGDKTAPAPLSIPLVEGFPSFGLRLPDLDENGKLRSLFVIGSVSRVDDRQVRIQDSLVESYAEDGSREISIELPEAVLDRVTRVLVAHVPVTIRREEFEVTGATMEFNTLTREGGLGGPVRMLLYNLDVDGEGTAQSEKTSNP